MDKLNINGIDLYKNPKSFEGVIGFVPQDDLLIEELTVLENLYYNGRLCFGNYDDHKLVNLVNVVLDSIGLSETKNLKGSNSILQKHFLEVKEKD